MDVYKGKERNWGMPQYRVLDDVGGELGLQCDWKHIGGIRKNNSKNL